MFPSVTYWTIPVISPFQVENDPAISANSYDFYHTEKYKFLLEIQEYRVCVKLSLFPHFLRLIQLMLLSQLLKRGASVLRSASELNEFSGNQKLLELARKVDQVKSKQKEAD